MDMADTSKFIRRNNVGNKVSTATLYSMYVHAMCSILCGKLDQKLVS